MLLLQSIKNKLGLFWVLSFIVPSQGFLTRTTLSSRPIIISSTVSRTGTKSIWSTKNNRSSMLPQPQEQTSSPKLGALLPPAAITGLWGTALMPFLWSCSSSASSSSFSCSYYLTRIVFLRALAFVYFVAFLVAYNQNKALIGDSGITPARFLLEEARERAHQQRARREAWVRDMFGNDDDNDNNNNNSNRRQISRENDTTIFQRIKSKLLLMLRRNPCYHRLREVLWDRADRMGQPLLTVLWLAKDFRNLNPWLDGVALTGMILAALVFALGAANVPILLILWICQRSLMAVGGRWYGYGWELQLAELGFHALFLVPLLSLNQIPSMPVPGIVLWTIRWYLFRIMMGAGLIKFKSGDKKWTDLTTMYYFYETQPVPNIWTRTMHFMPKAWHKFEVLVNHFVEVIAPFFLILPCLPPTMLRAAGLIQMQFQATLICTGNLSFLNWLTMVPAICCLDDEFLRGLFSPPKALLAAIAATMYSPSKIRTAVSLSFGALVMWLSIPVIRNLLSKKQQMNASFDKLRLINSYGAFGVVTEEREEWIISSAAAMNDNNNNNNNNNNNKNGEDGDNHNKYVWKEYEFKVKPGPVDRPPRWITPYHYRLDWQMWISASGRTIERSPWMYRFLVKLLQREKGVQKLLKRDPWETSPQNPKYIRVDAYRYRFHRPQKGRRGGDEGSDGYIEPYWEREFVRRIYPRRGVATVESLKDELKIVQPNRPV